MTDNTKWCVLLVVTTSCSDNIIRQTLWDLFWHFSPIRLTQRDTSINFFEFSNQFNGLIFHAAPKSMLWQHDSTMTQINPPQCLHYSFKKKWKKFILRPKTIKTERFHRLNHFINTIRLNFMHLIGHMPILLWLWGSAHTKNSSNIRLGFKVLVIHFILW